MLQAYQICQVDLRKVRLELLRSTRTERCEGEITYSGNACGMLLNWSSIPAYGQDFYF